jgi:hypothetical protein
MWAPSTAALPAPIACIISRLDIASFFGTATGANSFPRYSLPTDGRGPDRSAAEENGNQKAFWPMATSDATVQPLFEQA